MPNLHGYFIYGYPTHIPRRPKKKPLRGKKVGSAEKKLRLYLAGQERVRRQVGELPFWEFSAPILWRRWVGTDFSVLFGFGPKPGGFVVQKRNETPETLETLETPETLSVDVGIAFLSTFQRNLVAKLRMAFTEGKTNKECSYLGGLLGWKRTKSRYAKVGFAPKKLRLPNSGHVMVWT